ncbi:Holliday junction DNA helicase subunit RuvA [Stigmatella aurantiaca]|uniref:Holliday junction branch migration complex subunit RuvA n=1 Tax=Stigmatella aurantiaca TaxID=41 RepID=A0A1H7RJJ7_STIAU|nr:Holliday junction branch migration protein RuvA [Stigmatella aurantiaca]SEL60373.1 Holliday junction DNA helicase subunit RuvA [Stigmatella aurantiaca]
MIAALRGTVAEKDLEEAIIDVAGVGYRVAFSTLTLGKLPAEGQPVHVRVRTVVREDAFELFGFLSRAEEEMFLLLTSVSHVGPRLALTVLSGMEVGELAVALGKGELARLTKIHGVGKKTAERLVLELREKVKELHLETVARSATSASVPAGPKADLVSALLNLGYKAPQAEKAAELAGERLGPEAAFQALFREALKALRSGG